MRRTTHLSLSATIAVAISAALVCLVALVNLASNNALATSVRTAIVNADVVVSAPSNSAIDSTAIAHVRGVDGVQQVVPQLALVGVAANRSHTTVAAQSITNPATLTLREGRLPVGHSEAVLRTVTSHPFDARVGSQVTLQLGGADHRVTVVGLVDAAPGAVERPGLPTLLGSLEAVEEWSGQHGATRLLVTTDNPGQVVRTIRGLPAVSTNHVLASTGADYVEAHLQDYAPGARTILLGLRLVGLVTLLAALVVIGNTYTIKTAQRTRELAILRCLGAGKRQVFGSMLAEGLVTGLVGGLAGMLIAHALAAVMLRLVDVGLPLRWHTGALPVLLPVAAGVLSSLVAVLRPARRATRITPLEALRDTTPAPARSAGTLRSTTGLALVVIGLVLVLAAAKLHLVILSVVGGLLSVLGMVAGAPWIFPMAACLLSRIAGRRGAATARTVRANPHRTGTTAVAVWFGVTLITAVLVASATSSVTLGRTIDEGTPTDVIASATGPADTLSARLTALPAVAASTPVQSVMVDATVGSRQQLLTVVTWNQDLGHVLRSTSPTGRPLPGTISLPTSAGVRAGDAVVLQGRGKQTTLSAVIVDGQPGIGIVDAGDLAAIDIRPSADVWVKLVAGTDEMVALRSIRDLAGPESNISSPTLKRAEVLDSLHRFTVMATALLGAIIVIALVGMANALSLAVIERTHEFGLLRALGALRRQVLVMVLDESLLTTVTATVLGLGFGTSYGIGGVSALLSGEQLTVVPTIPWGWLLLVAMGSIPCSALAALVPARKAASVPPIAALSASGE